MSVKISRIELNQRKDTPSLAVFMYVGNEDPVEIINETVNKYVEDNEFFEFIDDNMDNPWTRVVLKDIESFNNTKMIVEGRTFNVHLLHKDTKVEIVYITYDDNKDDRPYPIMNLALIQLANSRGYNAFIDSDLSDIWSRLVIFGINDLPQEEFKNQKL